MLRRGRDSRVEAKASCRDAQWHLNCIKLRQIDAIPDTPDILERRIIVFGWFFEWFEASLPPEDITRHEALVKSGMRALLFARADWALYPRTLEPAVSAGPRPTRC